jgi:hypothetical protein
MRASNDAKISGNLPSTRKNMVFSEWFPVAIPPVHFGTYEAEDREGNVIPAAFGKRGWHMDDKLIVRWRGLSAPAHNAETVDPVELRFPVRVEEGWQLIYEAPHNVQTRFAETLHYDPRQDRLVFVENRTSNAPREQYPEGWVMRRWEVSREELITVIKERNGERHWPACAY